jgi:hypothetical protein
MRLSLAAALLASAMLAACGGGRQEGIVQFIGAPPQSAKQLAKDMRSAKSLCPHCRRAVEIDTNVCPDKNCKGQIRWADSYPCTSCQATGHCTPCVMLEQKDGKCFNCDGQGVKVYKGKAPACPNCKGEKTCPVCKGSRKCDYCQGAGKISKEVAKQRVPKVAGEEGDEEKPAAKPAEEQPKDAAPAEDDKQ